MIKKLIEKTGISKKHVADILMAALVKALENRIIRIDIKVL